MTKKSNKLNSKITKPRPKKKTSTTEQETKKYAQQKEYYFHNLNGAAYHKYGD